MARMRNIIKSTAEYTESFSGFRGIAPEGDSSVKSRLAYCQNVYRDYNGNSVGAIESIPGFRCMTVFSGRINGLHSFKNYVLVHAGTNLYHIDFYSYPSECDIYNLLTIEDAPSTAFTFGSFMYVLDGKNVIRVSDNESGLCSAEILTDFYVPTLYLNGTHYEARNLLTDNAKEEYDVIDAREYAAETKGLKYSIIDGDRLLCALSGIDEGVSGEIDIPGYKVIGGVRYQVSEIADSAFYQNSAITSVRIGEGVKRIGKMAFYRCTLLERIITPASLLSIDDAAINGCSSLSEVYLRSGLAHIGNAAFTASLSIESVHYEGSEAEFESIDGSSSLAALTKVYYSTDASLRAEFPLCSRFESVSRVTIDGEDVEYTLTGDEASPSGVLLSLDKHWQYNGSRLSIEGVLPELKSDFNGTGRDGSISGRSVIQRCTVSELFDGRLFLTGNPDLPSTVFYSSRTSDGEATPLYFGELNYFKDGTDASPIVSLLSVRSTLAVFKDSDDGMGSIFYHSGKDTEDDLLPRIYPVTDVHTGTRCLGGTLSFLDEAFFISPEGLNAIERQSLSAERGITQRCGNVASHLLSEDLSKAVLLEWMGYIAVCCGTRIYLADPRASFIGKKGNLEYEWFIIDGIGHYKNKTPVYRYSDETTSSQTLVKSDMVGEICNEVVYSVVSEGRTVFFTRENGNAYEVYKTNTMQYSDLIEPTKFLRSGNRMLFCSSSGGLFCFNDDMRGMIPPGMGITQSDYPDIARTIHPSLYSFDGIAPRYVVRTVKTDCGVPHLTKSSVKNSLAVKLGRRCSGSIVCEVGTDKNGHRECPILHDGSLNFYSIDFSNLSLAPEADKTVTVREKEKDWVEKDITLYADEDIGPIVVYGLAFRYKIKGRIKKN